MSIRLALDLDGCTVDSLSAWQTIAHKEGVTDPFDHQYNGIYKVRCSDGEIFANKLFGEYRTEWLQNAKPYTEVKEFIDRLDRNDKIQYWIVTSRGEDTKYLTVEWLEKHGITGYEDVIFTDDKTTAPCNVLVDDHIKHIKSYVDRSRMAYLVNRPYNHKYQVTRRVNGLLEIYQDILKYL